jgi:amino-acid N-acetyltransferase
MGMRVIRDTKEIEREKLTALLEASFKKKLDDKAFYERLEQCLDFVIVAGDYSGAAIVTKEPASGNDADLDGEKILYLDKFAVLPSHQGDGTVDFLWVALHDESYGLGLTSALNPNIGGKQGYGTGKDLVWRSRADNPVNKWYFERANGHIKLGSPAPGSPAWVMFWCDAEERLMRRGVELSREGEVADIEFGEGEANVGGNEARQGVGLGYGGKGTKAIPRVPFVDRDERGRLEKWGRVVGAIPSSWKKS